MSLGCKQCGAPLPDQFVIVTSSSSSPPPQPAPISAASPQQAATLSSSVEHASPSLASSIDVNSDSLPVVQQVASQGVPFSAQLEQRARQAEGESWQFLKHHRSHLSQIVISFNSSSSSSTPQLPSRVARRQRVCATCHFEICGQLNAEIAAEQQRLAAYRITLNGDNNASSRKQQSVDLLASRERELQARQEQLIKVLDAVLGDQQQLRTQTGRHFDELQSAYARERDLELQIFQKRERYAAFRDALAAAQNAATMREAQVRQLKSVRVHLDLFPIVQCQIGGVLTNMMSISGQRLGRFPGVPIDWEEINAALGECALLLDNIAAAAGAPNVRARVIPLGSRSLVQLLPPDAQAVDDRIDLSSTRLFALYGNDERAAFASSTSTTLAAKVGGILSSATASLFGALAPATAKQAVSSPLLSSRRGIDTSRRVGDDSALSASLPLDATSAAAERDTRTEFDCAIALLLCCVDDVAHFVRRSKPNFSNDWKEIELLPNEADDRGTVAEGVPVVRIGMRKARASRADMKEWTHAMKYMLHDLLQLLATVSRN